MLEWLIGIGVVLIILVILFLMQFYRDPKRSIPAGNDIVSPADGTILSIQRIAADKRTIKKGMIGRIHTLVSDIGPDCYVISIFMSPFDAHINRAPLEGTIVSTKHTSGKFFAAYDLQKSLLNEKNEIIMQTNLGKIKIIQIAGFLARRVNCRVSKGQKVNKGAKIGNISLGSQTTLIVPAKKMHLVVAKGDHVKAGSSIIAMVP